MSVPDTTRPQTPTLDLIQRPEDLRALPSEALPAVVDELRAELIDAVSRTGGHLGAGLGVVELTVALHRIFNTPDDRLIWDVGHQSYPHKILTERRDRIRSLRQKTGCRASCADRRANTTPLAPLIRRPRSLPHWAWPRA